MYEWDPAKNETNRRTRGVSFEAVHGFEWDSAVIRVDADLRYGEERLQATGFIGNSVYRLVYVERGNSVRVISLRKATKQEIKDYEDDYSHG